MPIWQDDAGNFISCIEKLKVMQQNLDELQQMAQDAFEDALLMGCSEKQVRAFLLELIQNIHNPYQK